MNSSRVLVDAITELRGDLFPVGAGLGNSLPLEIGAFGVLVLALWT